MSSLPLREPRLSPRNSTALCHVTWKVPTSESLASSDSTADQHSPQGPPCTLDSCLLSVLDFGMPDKETIHEVLERLEALGCPREVIRSIQEGRLDTTAVTTEPTSEIPVATPARTQVKVDSPAPVGVDQVGSAPFQVAVEPTAEYAASLLERGHRAAADGDYRVAVRYYLRAAEIQRGLAQKGPDKFNSPLALSLRGLAYCYTELGEYKDAVACGRQAVDLLRGFSQEKPGDYNHLLSESLCTLTFGLFKLGGYRDTDVYGIQAANIQRDFARRKSEKFNPELAHTFDNFAYCSEQLRRHDGVVKFGREAAVLYRSLVLDRPEETERFVKCLDRLSASLCALGLHDEALRTGYEMVNVKQTIKSASK